MFETEEITNVFQEENKEDEYAASQMQTEIQDNENKNYFTERDTINDLSCDNSSAEHDNEDLATQLLKVPNTVFTTAVTLGNFLFSAANYAGQAVKDASNKIIETVEENNIIGQFNKVQRSFINEKDDVLEGYLPPWVGYADEDIIKEECLSLSADKRNFLRSPPVGTDFSFNYNTSCLAAVAIMKEDPRLEKVRYNLVPKVVSEENFWKNYFYRVNLILQAHGIQKEENIFSSAGPYSELSDESWMKEIEDELNDYDETHTA